MFQLFPSSNTASATVYYFSSTHGDDSHSFDQASDPDTPWKSLSKMNEIFHLLKAGDSILLKNGEVFEGSINLSASGVFGKPITIAGYGEGHLPIISGWTTTDNWVPSERKGIWRTETGDQKQINLVEINGKVVEKGRYPNNGFLKYDVLESNVIKVNNKINPTEWKSASLAMRKNQWIIDRIIPDEYTKDGFILNQTTTYPPTDGYGLILQDHVNTLDKNGEWHHDVTSKFLFIYLDNPPSGLVQIRFSLQENLVTNEKGIRHIRFSGLCFSGSNGSAIHIDDAFDIEIIGSVIENAGEDAVHVLDTPSFRFNRNKVRFALNNGIFLRYGTPNTTISENEIFDIHPFFGMGKSGDGNGIGIHNISDFGSIKGNKLFKIGYSGIVFGGMQSEVIRNHIDSFCMVKNDGGGIYTYEGSKNKPSFLRVVKENIIENGIGTSFAIRNSTAISSPQVEGIYLDDNSSGILVEGNTIVNMRRNGIHLHNARKVIIQENLVADCQNQLVFSDDNLGDAITDIEVSKNTFASFKNQQHLITFSSNTSNFDLMAEFTNNLFLSPDSTNLQFLVRKQKENRDFTTFFHTSDELRQYGILLNNSKNLSVPESGKHNILAQGRQFNLEPSAFRDFCPNCTILKGDQETTVSYSVAHATAAIEVPPISADNAYTISFEAEVENQTTLHLLVSIGSSPWSNLSVKTPIRLYEGNHTYQVGFNNVVSAKNPVILISSQENSCKVIFRKITITPAATVAPLSAPKVIYNTASNEIISIPEGYSTILPEASTLHPYQAAIVF